MSRSAFRGADEVSDVIAALGNDAGIGRDDLQIIDVDLGLLEQGGGDVDVGLRIVDRRRGLPRLWLSWQSTSVCAVLIAASVASTAAWAASRSFLLSSTSR